MIFECKGMDYDSRLRVLNWTTLETRRLRANLLEVWKIVNGKEGLSENLFFSRVTPDTCNTKGHQHKFYKNRFNTDLAKFSFKNRVINEWNLLPTEVVAASSINSFKKQLDHHLGTTRGFK